MTEIFKGIPEIRFEGKDSTNPLAFKYYDADRVIMGKKMSEHLPFAMAWWHNLCAAGTDMFGRDTADKSFGAAEKGTMEHAKAKVDANYPKTYIWCSESDAVVPYANSLRMIEELKKNNVPVKSLICRNVDHGVGPATGTEAQGWIDKAVEFWLKEERE